MICQWFVIIFLLDAQTVSSLAPASPLKMDSISFPQVLVARWLPRFLTQDVLSLSCPYPEPELCSQSFLLGFFDGKWCFKEHNHFKSPFLWKWSRQAVPIITGQIFSGATRGDRCCKATLPRSRFWPLAGLTGRDHGEKPRKTQPSCLRILPAEQLAKSWQVWGECFPETWVLCWPSWCLKWSVWLEISSRSSPP